MRLRKRVEKLELDVYLAELETKATEKRLEQLECAHSNSTFQFNGVWNIYREKCDRCGKILREVSSEQYLSIKKARLVAELSAVNDAIKANKKHVADDCSTGIKK